MRWVILRPAAAVVGWGIAVTAFTMAVLGAMRFFLATGASPTYILRRKRWYESSVLGRPMGLRGLLHFGMWAAEQGRARHWP